jgi:hypothetical protein
MIWNSGYFYVVAIAALPGGVLFAQPAEEVLPLPLENPRRIDLKHSPAVLTPRGKAWIALTNTFGPQGVAERLLVSSIDQMRGEPYEWGGGTRGFAMRFGTRMSHLAIRNSISLGVDLAFRIDPRYDQCLCSGFKARSRHALRRVLMSRTDAGGEIPAIDNFAGAYITPAIYYNWYPDRLNTTNQRLLGGTLHLGWRAVGNMIREFWPEMRSHVPRRRNRQTTAP